MLDYFNLTKENKNFMIEFYLLDGTKELNRTTDMWIFSPLLYLPIYLSRFSWWAKEELHLVPDANLISTYLKKLNQLLLF